MVQEELAKILKPPVMKSLHHVLNTRDFVQHIKGIKIQQDECIMSYDVKALFTSVPIIPAINTIRDKLTDKMQGSPTRNINLIQPHH